MQQVDDQLRRFVFITQSKQESHRSPAELWHRGIMPCGRGFVVLGTVQWTRLMFVAFPFHRVKFLFHYLKTKHTGIWWLSSIQFSNLYIFSPQKAGQSPSSCGLRIDPRKVQVNICKASGGVHPTFHLPPTAHPALFQNNLLSELSVIILGREFRSIAGFLGGACRLVSASKMCLGQLQRYDFFFHVMEQKIPIPWLPFWWQVFCTLTVLLSSSMKSQLLPDPGSLCSAC